MKRFSLGRQVSTITALRRLSLKTTVIEDIIQRSIEQPHHTAITDFDTKLTYQQLINLSVALKDVGKAETGDQISNTRVSFLTGNDSSYLVAKLSIWMCDSAVVPLSPKHPIAELEYFVKQSRSQLIVAHPQFKQTAAELSLKTGVSLFILPDYLLDLRDTKADVTASSYDMMNKDAMILYTSGTTGRPKGVLMNHLNVKTQALKVVESWKWTNKDEILHVLPLHHTHGIVNALLCPLLAGARVTMETAFDAKKVWNRFMTNADKSVKEQLNVFMAVPTIYTKLIEYYEKNISSTTDQADILKAFSTFRLMVSGSAALPVPVLEKWSSISGHVLLERYGMTEFGMGLTNPYEDGKRKPGHVGLPFPYTQVRIVGYDENGNPDYDKTMVEGDANSVTSHTDDVYEGELLVKSPSLFTKYFDNPQATEESFHDGWFKTGDTCSYVNGSFKIIGRSSVDIIKSGGYKIGAIDIEATLLNHPQVKEVAVLGLSDPIWGQIVTAVVVTTGGAAEQLTGEDLKKWSRYKMAPYKIPRKFVFLPAIKRNAMGKINKKELARNISTQL